MTLRPLSCQIQACEGRRDLRRLVSESSRGFGQLQVDMCSGTHLGTATIAPGGLRLYTARWCNHRLWTSDCTRCTVWAIKPSSPGDAPGTATQGAMVGALPGGRTERKWATLCSCLLCTVTLSGWGQRLPAHLLPKKEKEGKEVQTKELQYGVVFIFGECFFLAVISGTGNDWKQMGSVSCCSQKKLAFAVCFFWSGVAFS